MILLIDDMRDLHADAIARNALTGEKLLAAFNWDLLKIDHDLGVGRTGYDVLTWALENSRCPERVILVTSNPVGLKRMGAALKAHGYNDNGCVTEWAMEGKDEQAKI